MPIGYDQKPGVRTLPDQPDLERLKNEARTLQRQVRAGNAVSVELVRTFHPSPRLGQDFPLTEAQLTIARSYGFGSWPRLREHVKMITELTRFPGPADDAGDAADPVALEQQVDRLLRLASLNYTDDRASAVTEARALLERHPELAAANVYTMAATGAADDLARLLADRPELANTDGGPYRWAPLLYLCYGRLGDSDGRSAVEAARVLLNAGADPNAGYLWHGLRSPFTALTGVFGGGEQDQPVHPDADALARLLLEAGADPNDNQALYNRMFRDSDDHLRLLFAYGLGTEFDSPWRRLIGDHYPTNHEMITEQMRWAADHAMADRIRLLLAEGVDVDGRGYHPIFGDRTPYHLAVLAGHTAIAEQLAAAGADTSVVDQVDALVGACMAGDAASLERATAADPTLPDQAKQRWPGAIWKATEKGNIDAVRRLIELGFDPSCASLYGRTALHQAAVDGHGDIVELLLDHGADPTVTEGSYHSRPSGWAEHGGHKDLAARLREAEQQR